MDLGTIDGAMEEFPIIDHPVLVVHENTGE